jgi:uncharacterized protein (DUF433 family)
VEHTSHLDAWRRRLYIPNYQVREAARYAGVSTQTVVAWQRDASKMISAREKREALSYLQLIEVAVVAAFRKAGVSMKEIRASREYLAKRLSSEHPFAHYSFKTDGKSLFMDYDQLTDKNKTGVLLRPSKGGQLAWNEIIGRLNEFEYERKGIVVRWHVDGNESPIIIDPRIAFGAPTINGIPTWIIKGRWEAGETLDDIKDDFGLNKDKIIEALKFEDIAINNGQEVAWKH